MTTTVRRSDRSRRSAVRPIAYALLVLLAVGVLASTPASAQLDLPLTPLPLPTSLDPLTDTIDDVTSLVTDVPEQLGGIVEETTASLTVPKPTKPVPIPKTQRPPTTDSWSIDRLPALQDPATVVPTRVSGASYRRPLSYGAAVSGGFRAAMGRAASLAGPLAAPIGLALVAVCLLAIAARGPGRLVKVEEESRSFRERRSYRL